MTDISTVASHEHVFLGEGHEHAERRTWAVIWLCGAMMLLEIAGGIAFGSIALVADGLHMSTHAGALLLAAIAYSYARRHARDPRFCFGTGKVGDLAGFTSAVILALIAVLIGYEAIGRLIAPQPIRFGQALPIAMLGLFVNVVSAWLLSGGHHHHGHSHGHDHGHNHHDHGTEAHAVPMPEGAMTLSIEEEGRPPVFRLASASGHDRVDFAALAGRLVIRTERPDGVCEDFALHPAHGGLESLRAIPEPHAFTAHVIDGSQNWPVTFEEHDHAHDDHAHHADHNMRAAIVHVMADAAVSVLVIAGLLLARAFGWLWMDPLAGLVGAGVIASWSFGLIRDTAAVLLDFVPDRAAGSRIRAAVEADGDRVTDLHLWRLGPGHLGAIVSVSTAHGRDAAYFRDRVAAAAKLSHLTVEVNLAARAERLS